VGFGARAVVIATGARYRRLDLPGLADLEGTGVCYAATLEEAARHADHAVAIVGGGNSADAVLPRPCRPAWLYSWLYCRSSRAFY
jgi:thioredoxin reductase